MSEICHACGQAIPKRREFPSLEPLDVRRLALAIWLLGVETGRMPMLKELKAARRTWRVGLPGMTSAWRMATRFEREVLGAPQEVGGYMEITALRFGPLDTWEVANRRDQDERRLRRLWQEWEAEQGMRG